LGLSANRHALVLGAGLAGAACCAALTRRGWRVDLIEQAPGPAQAASGLPVGMLSPHVTRAPTPLSRLCALGVPDARAELERLVPQGHGWQATEVDNLGHDPGRWPAALVRPAALVQAWLAEASDTGHLACHWGHSVDRLEHTGGAWRALSPSGHALGTAPCVVVASAYGALSLLQGRHGFSADNLPLRPVKGQLSLAPLADRSRAPRPMRNSGVYVPEYQDQGLAPQWPTRIWAMGSTYERGRNDTEVRPQAHERNGSSLQDMHPGAAAELSERLAAGTLLGWSQVRCASLDRLPLVGAAPDVNAMMELVRTPGLRRGRLPLTEAPRLPGLFMLTALGSRGLTLAHWCAGWLAASMDRDDSTLAPENRDLESAFDPARFAWRQARRQAL
jgi:tRNA 5-methylaminomethyl-2-thiouridine biosynthesis bifunctional protein